VREEVIKCDAFGTTRDVRPYRVEVIDTSEPDETEQGVVYAKDLELSERGLNRLLGMVHRGARPPGISADQIEAEVNEILKQHLAEDVVNEPAEPAEPAAGGVDPNTL